MLSLRTLAILAAGLPITTFIIALHWIDIIQAKIVIPRFCREKVETSLHRKNLSFDYAKVL